MEKRNAGLGGSRGGGRRPSTTGKGNNRGNYSRTNFFYTCTMRKKKKKRIQRARGDALSDLLINSQFRRENCSRDETCEFSKNSSLFQIFARERKYPRHCAGGNEEGKEGKRVDDDDGKTERAWPSEKERERKRERVKGRKNGWTRVERRAAINADVFLRSLGQSDVCSGKCNHAVI